MPRSEIGPSEIEAVLADGDVVRVAFHDGEGIYLIPLAYVWRACGLYGVTEPGRKTRLANASSRVAFQVDTAVRTGLFEWESIMGSGCFEIVRDDDEKRAALDGLLGLAEDAPGWWRDEQALRMASGDLLVWRIRPDSITGVRYDPSPDAGWQGRPGRASRI